MVLSEEVQLLLRSIVPLICPTFLLYDSPFSLFLKRSITLPWDRGQDAFSDKTRG
jgi:hypothetical protein